VNLRSIRAYCIAAGKLLMGLVPWADLGVDDGQSPPLLTRCLSSARSVILPTCQTVHFRPSRHSSAGSSASLPIAQTISMAGTISLDPDIVRAILVEGAVQTLFRQIPAERQAHTAAATPVELLDERSKAHRDR